MSEARRFDGFVPGRWPIDAYGNGGFRFAEMSHKGSILALPSGVSIWPVTAVEAMTPETLAAVLAEDSGVDLLLIGSGAALLPVPASVRAALSARRIGCEVMSTPAAARTYNVLVGEARRVAAALIAVA